MMLLADGADGVRFGRGEAALLAVKLFETGPLAAIL